MSTLKLAVIGGGHLGRIHAKLAQTHEQFEVVAVADPSPLARRQVEEQLELPTVADYHELIGQVDAAIVAAPTLAHYEITSTLLRAGIHTLVEKPLASSADQAQRLVQIARSHGRVLQTGHVERFNPSWTAAQPHLGRPKFIEAVRAGAYSGRSTDIGVVMDLMIHDLDLILSLDRSPVQEIYASGVAVLGAHEDMAEARLHMASGCIVNLRASRLASTPTRRMQLYTTESYADINFSAGEVEVVKPSTDILLRAVALDELPLPERLAAKDSIFGTWLQRHKLAAPSRNAILDEHHDFALSIQTGAAPSVTGEDGARAVEVASRIVDTLRRHAWDGEHSKSWRIGPQALVEPTILPFPAAESPRRDRRQAG